MIYLDEPGNLGFGERAGKHFTMAAIIARDPIKVGKCPKRVCQLRLSKNKTAAELKFHNSSQTIRERKLDCIGRTGTP